MTKLDKELWRMRALFRKTGGLAYTGALAIRYQALSDARSLAMMPHGNG